MHPTKNGGITGILRGVATITDCDRSHNEQVLQQFLDTESAPSILFDPDHAVVWANQSALLAFPNLYEEGMAKSLKTILPDPTSHLRQLQARLGVRDRVTEDVITRKSQFRAVLHRMGLGRLLLRLEQITEKGVDGPSNGTITAVPIMTISAKGTVLSMNEAMRQIVGKRVHHVDRVFSAPLPETGEVALIMTAGGATDRVRVYHTALAGDRREVAVMQGGLGSDAPRSGFNADDLPVALLHLGRNGLIVDANEPARALLRLEEGQPFGALGDAVSDLGRSIPDWVNEAIGAATPAKPEVVRLQNSTDENFIQIGLSAGRHDGVPEVTAVLHDATELKTLESQFVQGQKMQAIGQLAGGVAHDFNNLLTAISGYCDLLLLRHDQGDSDYADLEQINQNANRASALVGQLFAFSRKQTLLPEVIDLRDTLADLTHLLNRLVGEKMMLSLYHDPDLPAVRADKRQLEQVLMNLVVNARDAMPDGGDITIETKRVVLTEPLKKVRAVVPIGEYACISVCDQGIGIPSDLLYTESSITRILAG
jgi:two-component system cell cycle sensor histidine kinase/response regulator CckA